MTDDDARRYLHGEATEDERSRIEQDYFADADALDRMEAAEEALVEDYLADRLSPEHRALFEREFLPAPYRRARIATIRALMAAASRRASVDPEVQATAARTPRRLVRVFSLAAAAVVLMAASVWWAVGGLGGHPSSARRQAAAPIASEAPVARALPRIFAVAVSPAAARSAGETSSARIPASIDLVELRLESDPGDTPVAGARVVVRTVAGAEIWQGAAVSSDPTAGIAAIVDVPAARLPGDDYVISLFTATPDGGEREAYQYFLRILAR